MGGNPLPTKTSNRCAGAKGYLLKLDTLYHTDNCTVTALLNISHLTGGNLLPTKTTKFLKVTVHGTLVFTISYYSSMPSASCRQEQDSHYRLTEPSTKEKLFLKNQGQLKTLWLIQISSMHAVFIGLQVCLACTLFLKNQSSVYNFHRLEGFWSLNICRTFEQC